MWQGKAVWSSAVHGILLGKPAKMGLRGKCKGKQVSKLLIWYTKSREQPPGLLSKLETEHEWKGNTHNVKSYLG